MWILPVHFVCLFPCKRQGNNIGTDRLTNPRCVLLKILKYAIWPDGCKPEELRLSLTGDSGVVISWKAGRDSGAYRMKMLRPHPGGR